MATNLRGQHHYAVMFECQYDQLGIHIEPMEEPAVDIDDQQQVSEFQVRVGS